MVEHPQTFKNHNRNATVIAAICVLAIAAMIEVLLAGIALAPRILTALRNNSSAASVATTQAPSTVAPDVLKITTALAAAVKQSLPNPQPLPLQEATVQSDAVSDIPTQTSSISPSGQDSNILGIVNVKLAGDGDRPKTLDIYMKASPKEQIDVPQIRVQVYFYDQDGGEITASKAQSISKWISSGTDWKNGEPEVLEVRYLPDSSDPDVKFAGYVVAIYYKGDLQDYRAEPSKLTRLFPLKYFIGTDE